MKKNKTTSLSKNKLFQATIIVSIILLSFTIYLSQTNNQTAKATTSTNITGTIVITDHPLNTNDYKAQIYLPSTNCAGEINYCYSDGTTANSLCKTTPIIHNIGNKYDLILNTPQAITQISLSYECVPQNNGPITGTIIISDQLLNTKDYQAITYLPNCSILSCVFIIIPCNLFLIFKYCCYRATVKLLFAWPCWLPCETENYANRVA